MSSSFDADFAAANDLFSEAFGEEVTLVRAAYSTDEVPAQVVEQGSEIQTQTRMGSRTSFIDRSWLILKTDYVIDGSAVTPAAGDRIVDSDGTTWEVMNQQGKPSDEEDSGGLEWLVRTKRIASA